MTVGLRGFQPGRLVQARALRGVHSQQELSDLTDITKQMISRYESGKSSPPEEKIERIAQALNFDMRFFFTHIEVDQSAPVLFRSVREPLKHAVQRADAVLQIGEETLLFVEEFVDLPEYGLPRVCSNASIQSLSSEMIETAAQATREAMGFPFGPLPNLVALAERAGIIVIRTFLADRELDGLSRWRNPHPVIVLNDSKSPARSRFDLAHEIGHLVLHSYVPNEFTKVKSLFGLMEEQAHSFASALLLPSEEFRNSVWTATLDEFQTLKVEWQTSIQAMIRRSKDLGIISDEEYRRLFVRIGTRGWRFKEPLEDLIREEVPTVLRSSLEIIYDQVPGGSALIDMKLPFRGLLEEISSGPLPWITASLPDNIVELRRYR